MSDIIKVCGCGRQFSRLTFDLLQRPERGDRLLSEDQDEAGKVTARYVTYLRNCLCGSTIAIEERLDVPEREAR